MKPPSRLARLVPDRLFVRTIARVHPRVEPEIKHLFRALPAGGTFVDVGGWYGPWSLWMAKKADRVIVFEPNPSVADVLSGSLPSNATLYRSAVSREGGHATLSVPAGGRGTEGRASLGEVADSDHAHEVDTVCLDGLQLSDVRLIKIDVEGHEQSVLEGAEQLINEQRPVMVIEIEQRWGDPQHTIDWLSQRGYRAQTLVGSSWMDLKRFDLFAHQRDNVDRIPTSYLSTARAPLDQRYVNNVVFVPSEKPSWVPTPIS